MSKATQHIEAIVKTLSLDEEFSVNQMLDIYTAVLTGNTTVFSEYLIIERKMPLIKSLSNFMNLPEMAEFKECGKLTEGTEGRKLFEEVMIAVINIVFKLSLEVATDENVDWETKEAFWYQSGGVIKELYVQTSPAFPGLSVQIDAGVIQHYYEVPKLFIKASNGQAYLDRVEKTQVEVAFPFNSAEYLCKYFVTGKLGEEHELSLEEAILKALEVDEFHRSY